MEFREMPVRQEKTKPQTAIIQCIVISFVVLRFDDVSWTLLWLVSTHLTFQNQIKVLNQIILLLINYYGSWIKPEK